MEFALSLGTNLGNRLANLQKAVTEMAERLQPAYLLKSKVYETEPVGVQEAYRDLAYLNAVVVLDYAGTSRQLSAIIHAIEADLGRVRGPDRNAPRIIDIDILYAGSELSDSDDLTLPHPRWAERRFVVRPLADLRPELVFPLEQRTVADILHTLPDSPAVTLYPADW